MKTILHKISFSLVLLLLMSGSRAFAQTAETKQPESRKETIQIKTSAECEMCKTRIEKEMGNMKGVKSADLDLTTRILTVTYNPKKTNPDAIRQAIAKVGYDADDVKANNKSFQKLPECCKKNSGKE